MNTYTIKYEAGALAKTVQAVGTDIHDAIKSLGFKDSDTFMAMRVITWAKNDGAPLAPGGWSQNPAAYTAFKRHFG